QGYYDQQAYGDPNQQGYYDQQAYGDPNQQGYYDGSQHEPPDSGVPRRKRKIESVKDYFNDMLGEGYVFATDANDSPHQYEPVSPAPQAYTPQYPPPHLVPQNPLAQALGPIFSIYIKLREKWAFLVEKFNHYTDMLLDVQESVQKEFKEAFNLAFKGFMDQLKQKSPLGMPYQQPLPAYAQQSGQPYDPAMGPYPPQQGPTQPPVSFVDLYELNVSFTDNYDEPLFDFSKYANSQYQVSKMVADPVASEAALWAIQECAQRAGAIPPAQEGPYANLPLTQVMGQATMEDLQAFLRYVKAFPGNYVSRNLKVSETFATWVVYGAPAP
ncbi:MAG: hypothetical protein IGS03_06235, partial [Candidatus Sericytochromatia bacterium]|nr:hypothetical protein [Candidatus Sericytochromatia bacterium]